MATSIKSNIDGFQMTVNYQQVVQLVDKFLENDTKYLQLHELLNASSGKHLTVYCALLSSEIRPKRLIIRRSLSLSLLKQPIQP